MGEGKNTNFSQIWKFSIELTLEKKAYTFSISVTKTVIKICDASFFSQKRLNYAKLVFTSYTDRPLTRASVPHDRVRWAGAYGGFAARGRLFLRIQSIISMKFWQLKCAWKGEGIIEKSFFFSFFGLRIGFGAVFRPNQACKSYFLKSESLANQ